MPQTSSLLAGSLSFLTTSLTRLSKIVIVALTNFSRNNFNVGGLKWSHLYRIANVSVQVGCLSMWFRKISTTRKVAVSALCLETRTKISKIKSAAYSLMVFITFFFVLTDFSFMCTFDIRAIFSMRYL